MGSVSNTPLIFLLDVLEAGMSVNCAQSISEVRCYVMSKNALEFSIFLDVSMECLARNTDSRALLEVCCDLVISLHS